MSFAQRLIYHLTGDGSEPLRNSGNFIAWCGAELPRRNFTPMIDFNICKGCKKKNPVAARAIERAL